MQTAEVRAKFVHVAVLLEDHGLDVGRPHVAPVTASIWELRAVGTNRRTLYFAAPGHRLQAELR